MHQLFRSIAIPMSVGTYAPIVTPPSPSDELLTSSALTAIVDTHHLVGHYIMGYKTYPSGSASGADFYRLISDRGQFMLKTGRRVGGDVRAYEWICENPLIASVFLSPHEKIMGYRDPSDHDNSGYHLTPFIHGQDAYDFLCDSTDVLSSASELFNHGISKIISHFFENESPCHDKLGWLTEKTCGEALHPFKRIDNPEVSAILANRTVLVKDATVTNGLDILRRIGAPSSDSLHIMQAILFPRKIATSISDPTYLNELIVSGVPKFIDPGTPRKQQLGYVLCKHEGPFALAFPAFKKGDLEVVEIEKRYVITTTARYEKLKVVHDIRNVMSRIDTIRDSDGPVTRERPFFMVHLMFYGARQFFRDLAYAVEQDDRQRIHTNLVVGSVAMTAMHDILELTANKLIDRYGHRDHVLAAFDNPEKFLELNTLSMQAYTEFISTESPLATMFRALFVSEPPTCRT